MLALSRLPRDQAPLPAPDNLPRWRTDRPSLALCAMSPRCSGIVVYAIGQIRERLVHSIELDRIGLDDAPTGLSVWKGWVAGDELVGSYRSLFPHELVELSLGRMPWDVTDWMTEEYASLLDVLRPPVPTPRRYQDELAQAMGLGDAP